MSLKQKTVNGVFWSFIDSSANQIFQFIIGIILARLLSPREFGLIGMLTVFLALSDTFVNSGFKSALIRKKDCTQKDFSTVFFYNLTVALFLYLILFFSSGAISSFFKEPQLKSLLQVLGIVLLIDSLALIQGTIIHKKINFKLQARISVLASLISGASAIIMAYYGFGVWSLVAKRLLQQTFNTIFLWIWNKWRPTLEFSKESFKELFGFGSKLLATSLIDTTYKNIYLLIIGKYFSAQDLGYYTRANQFRELPVVNITTVLQRVSYPVLAEIQEDKVKLKDAYKKMIQSIMLLTFSLLLTMVAISKPMILTLIGEKWSQSIIYLQMLCFVGLFYPLQVMNLSMLQVQGRSDLILKLEIVKKSLAVPTIILGIYFGIKVMIIAMFFNSAFSYYLNSYYSGKFLGYPIREQLWDITPAFLIALITGVLVFAASSILPFSNLINLILLLALAGILIFSICEISRFKPYIYMKTTLFDHLKQSKKNRSK